MTWLAVKQLSNEITCKLKLILYIIILLFILSFVRLYVYSEDRLKLLLPKLGKLDCKIFRCRLIFIIVAHLRKTVTRHCRFAEGRRCEVVEAVGAEHWRGRSGGNLHLKGLVDGDGSGRRKRGSVRKGGGRCYLHRCLGWLLECLWWWQGRRLFLWISSANLLIN